MFRYGVKVVKGINSMNREFWIGIYMKFKPNINVNFCSKRKVNNTPPPARVNLYKFYNNIACIFNMWQFIADSRNWRLHHRPSQEILTEILMSIYFKSIQHLNYVIITLQTRRFGTNFSPPSLNLTGIDVCFFWFLSTSINQ